MAARSLRAVAIASFLPAFPLLLAHGIVSHSPVPATGLVPLAFSAGVSLFLLLRPSKKSSSSSPEDAVEQAAEHAEPVDESSDPWTHPILVFAVDVILAAALIVVLVFSWLQTTSSSGQLAMLATYGTIPLLTNLFIHLYFAVRAFHTGLALYDLTQWLAWQVVPADCPDCGHRLRPTSPPTIPWFESVRKIKLPAAPRVKAPQWKAPAWLKNPTQGFSPLFVNNEERYRDEPDHGEPSTQVEEPAEVAVRGKRDKKGKDVPVSPVAGNEPEW